MQIAADDLRRIERLHVRAWPAFETANIDGWLWRYSGGGSQRANSVSTVDFAGADPALALDEVEARYRARNAMVRVHTYDLSAPAGIVDLLQGRGYGAGETTLTMVKAVGTSNPRADVEVAATPNTQWREVYLGAISETTASDGDLVWRNNVSLPQRLWRWCAAHEVRLVYASSAAFPVGAADRSYRPHCASPTEISRLSNAWRRAQRRGGKAARTRCFAALRHGRPSGA